jgi:hypothetical protein
MAEKTSKAGTTVQKEAPKPADQGASQPDRARAEADMQRLLREAAWSRMFGKAGGEKNPFAR